MYFTVALFWRIHVAVCRVLTSLNCEDTDSETVSLDQDNYVSCISSEICSFYSIKLVDGTLVPEDTELKV